MFNRRKPKSASHKERIREGLKRYWRNHGIETATVLGVSALTSAGLLLGKKKIVKSIEEAAERGFKQGAKEGVSEMAPKIQVTVERQLTESTPEIVSNIKQGTKEAIVEGIQRKATKEAGSIELQQLREERALPATDGTVPVYKRFKNWVDYKRREGIAQRKKNLGFNKHSNKFWIKFNSRKAANIEFSSNRKPMSEATKRKISKSVARSKGRTAGYDTNKVNVSVNNSQGNFIDNGIESIGKLTKAISPILRYINEKERLKESTKKRKIREVNTAIYGLGTGSRIINSTRTAGLARERLLSRENTAASQLRSRETLERLKTQSRIELENLKLESRAITARAYEKQPRMTAASILTNPNRVIDDNQRAILNKILNGEV